MNNKAANIFITTVLIVLVVIIVYLGAERFGLFDKGKEPKTIVSDNLDSDVTDTNTNTSDNTEVTMIFGGDFLLSNEVINAYNKNGGSVNNIMGTNLHKLFTDADIAMVNNEFPYSNRGTQAPDKQFTFRADPSYVNVLTEMGVDMVSLANNHSLDFGEDALIDTIDTLKGASIKYGGAGNNLDEAKEIQYFDLNGKKIAILCASRVIPVGSWNATSSKPGLFTTYDPTALCSQLNEAENNADISIVFVHWGLERKEMPEDYQRTLGKQYIDAGADLVIGAHSHCLQGMELYKGKLITYSLGNFIFNGKTADTMALKAVIGQDNSIKAQFLPCVSRSYQTEIAGDSDYSRIIDYYKSISYSVDIDSSGNVNMTSVQSDNSSDSELSNDNDESSDSDTETMDEDNVNSTLDNSSNYN